MYVDKRLNRFFCLFLIFVLFFSFLPVATVSASSVLSDQEYYAYWYADNYCGVDWSQYSSTDDGSTIEDYTQRKGQKSFSQAIEDVAGEVQTAADTTYSRVYDAAKETVSKAYTTTAKAAEYVAEKANRTLETAAGTAYSVAGGSFWSSVFNDLFNNEGYKTQYQNISDGSWSGNIGEHTIEFIPRQDLIDSHMCSVWSGTGSPLNVVNNYSNTKFYSGYASLGNYYNFTFELKYDGVSYFMNNGGSGYSGYIGNSKILNVSFGDTTNNKTPVKVTYSYTGPNGSEKVLDIYFGIYGDTNFIENGYQEELPPQIGFIRLPNGDIVPVYTDKTKNDFDINDNGTVTLPNGDVVPIYIYPDELNPVGQTQILKFINTMPFQLPFGTNDSLPISSDGEGGSFLEGLGQLIGDIFSGLFDGLVEVLKTIADIIKGLFNLIAGLFKGDYFNNLKFQLFDFNPFDIIKSGISKIFELFGVVIS